MCASGDLDGAAAEALERVVRGVVAAGGREVFVDLSAALTIATAAIDVLAALGECLAALDGALTLAARHRNCRDYVLKKVEAGSLGSMLGVHPPLDDAIFRSLGIANGAVR